MLLHHSNISITHAEVMEAAHTLAFKIKEMYDNDEIRSSIIYTPQRKNPEPGLILYGVPESGIESVYALNAFISNCMITDNIARADVIVDCIERNGKTRKGYENLNPNAVFVTLFDISTTDDRYRIFPWQAGKLPSQKKRHNESIVTDLLRFIGEDTDREGLQETPKRFLKAWKHYTKGYAEDPADILKVFEDGAEGVNEMVLVKQIPVYSTCEHHGASVFGVAHVAYIPNGKIVGLSKINRVVDCFARRLQVQERLTTQIADALNDNLNPLGVAVVLECRHMCMESRGISQQGHTTVTSAMRGAFMDEPATRAEFMGLIK